jgi:hypothetical protein
MRKFLFCLTLFFVQYLHAQSKYFIYFTDKNGVQFNAFEYFDVKAIERRIREGIALADTTDFPVKTEYIHSIVSLCDSTAFTSRWLNGMSVFATHEQISAIQLLPFVKHIECMQAEPTLVAQPMMQIQSASLHEAQLALLRFQTYRHQAEAFTGEGIDGSGIRIAVFDVGFPGVDTHPAFEHLRIQHKIIGAYDFIGNDENPYHGNAHGTSCLSCIAGYYDTIAIGLATGAEFLLAKTERMYTEFQSEEDAWLAAAEWADKNGADIISSSLGYTKQRYHPAQMNGNVSLVAKAAKMASEKGILVVNAAGNEGDGIWEYLATPADVEEVMSVGGIDPYTDAHISFSSFGPNADYKRKPNVVSLGQTVAANAKDYETAFGTSFATPLVAGFAACAWQKNKHMSRSEIFNAIERSAHLFPYYDYAHGYGVPLASYFTNTSVVSVEPTFTLKNFVVDSGYILLEIDTTRFTVTDLEEQKNLYYNFSDAQGKIIYFSVLVPDNHQIKIYAPSAVNNARDYFLHVHFEKYTFTLPIN